MAARTQYAKLGMPLTEREMKVLESMASGDSGKETAAQLGVSVETVKTFRAKIIVKLGARNGCHAVWIYARGKFNPRGELTE
jgi:DNA-binding NarL/FixJ family response regulator